MQVAGFDSSSGVDAGSNTAYVSPMALLVGTVLVLVSVGQRYFASYDVLVFAAI